MSSRAAKTEAKTEAKVSLTEPASEKKESGDAGEATEPYEWPNLGDEAIGMLNVSILVYGIAGLRNLARKKLEKDPDDADAKELLELPVTADEVHAKVKKHEKELKATSTGQQAFRAIDIFEKNTKAEGAKPGEIFVFDDEESDHNMVYSVGVNHVAKRVSVGFRGSVTPMDWVRDAEVIMKTVPSPAEKDKTYAVHLGFHDYLYAVAGKNQRKDKILSDSKCAKLLEEVASACAQYPSYRLYITGHSLGGALAALFCVEAGASEDPRIPKPVTCITIAGPKVGNVDFCRAASYLEHHGKLRLMRVLNVGDVVPQSPYVNPALGLSYTLLNRSSFFRHVGVKLVLRPVSSPSHYKLRRPTTPDESFGAKMRESGKYMVDIIEAPFECLYSCTGSKFNPINLHRCGEYTARLRVCQDELNKMTLNDFYREEEKKHWNLHAPSVDTAWMHHKHGSKEEVADVKKSVPESPGSIEQWS